MSGAPDSVGGATADYTEFTSMSYQSIDRLQNALTESVFHYAKDRKKAAGRALGTIVEVITFYLLKSWGFEQSLSIERPLPEFGNPEITHNVEYSLHPILAEFDLSLKREKLPIRSAHLFSELPATAFKLEDFRITGNTLLTTKEALRNSCVIATSDDSHLVATLKTQDFFTAPLIAVVEQFRRPYALFECKRVGIEEGRKKGPQTIEKAKQGAYVARSVSSLHKVRMLSGELRGIIHLPDETIYSLPYEKLIAEVIGSQDKDVLAHFVMTVGVVSNHGNWFTSENHNKELKVLAQSYDWLLFLTDAGLAEFITDLLLSPVPELAAARNAFLSSYSAEKKVNSFTKISMDYKADRVLEAYFIRNAQRILDWFNIITPKHHTAAELRSQLSSLRDKNWKAIHRP
jgi:hypothetical protein